MDRIETEILIAGGGIAGLSAAARLGADGHDVVLADPAPPGTAADQRTTAFLHPAVETLSRAGAWEAMAAGAAPLATMRIVDAGGRERVARTTADFAAEEIQDRPFGYNVTNIAARAALLDRLAALPNVRLLLGQGVSGIVTRTAEVLARLGPATQVRARLAIAADGRDSFLREQAGIGATRWSYGQRALVFAVIHQRPHRQVSTEIHRSGGPCTLVPMPDRDGRPCSSVVWMVPGPRAEALAAHDDTGLGQALTAETLGLYGPLSVTGPRAVWPIIGQLAHRIAGERLALIAEAAHVIPPIGAQGLNMSLADIECLAGLLAEADDPGAPGLLARYQARRWPEMAARVAGVDALNRAALAEAQPLRDLRHLGLKAIHGLPPLRGLAMRLGMGMNA